MIKKNTNTARPDHLRVCVFAVLALGLLGALVAGILKGFQKLDAIWSEQFRIANRDLDVVVTTGKRVHPEIITMCFGLTNGANLAEIPFGKLRADLLERFPNIRDIRIERRLPQRVNIDVLEREPIVRITSGKSRGETGRVADLEGVVFRFDGETGRLPVIHESSDTATVPGKRLGGSAAAALLLVEVASQPEFADLGVRDIDTSHADYLLVSLADQNRVQIAWSNMSDRSKASRDSLTTQLKCVQDAIGTHLTGGPKLWLATDWSSPVRVTATSLQAETK